MISKWWGVGGGDSYSQGRLSFASWSDMNEGISIVSTAGSDISKHTDVRPLMRRPVWNTEWTLNAPYTNATAPFPRATDVTPDSVRLEGPGQLTDLASSPPWALRLRRVDLMCSAPTTPIWSNSAASHRVPTRRQSCQTCAYRPSLKTRALTQLCLDGNPCG